MKAFISLILLLLVFNASAQIDASYDEVQEKYGTENTTINSFDNYFSETKDVGENFRITFTYNTDKIVKMVSVTSEKGKITNDEFHKLSKEFMRNFSITSKARTVKSNFYYDSKHSLLTVFEKYLDKKKQAKSVTFISGKNLITKINSEILKME